jgi:hypothetical protein
VVAIALRTDPERPIHSGRPRTVYFVKLRDNADPMHQPELLRSSFAKDGVHYLLDAPAGRYAAVACDGRSQELQWSAYFPESLIRATEREVPEGKAVLLGSVELELRPITTTGDQAQQHYLRVLHPKWIEQKAALKLFTKDEHAWGGKWIDLGDGADVLERMRKGLGAAWASRFSG